MSVIFSLWDTHITGWNTEFIKIPSALRSRRSSSECMHCRCVCVCVCMSICVCNGEGERHNWTFNNLFMACTPKLWYFVDLYTFALINTVDVSQNLIKNHYPFLKETSLDWISVLRPATSAYLCPAAVIPFKEDRNVKEPQSPKTVRRRWLLILGPWIALTPFPNKTPTVSIPRVLPNWKLDLLEEEKKIVIAEFIRLSQIQTSIHCSILKFSVLSYPKQISDFITFLFYMILFLLQRHFHMP